jgi:hypothetical protein
MWAGANLVHPAVIEYVRSDPTVFDKPHSNPRSWKYVSDLVRAAELQAAEGKVIDPSIVRVGIVGCVGAERAAAFLRLLKCSDRPLSAEMILGSYGQYRKQIQGWINNNGKLDMVAITLHALKIYLQPRHDFEAVKVDRKRWNNLARFLYDLPGDLLTEAKAYFADHTYAFPKHPKN